MFSRKLYIDGQGLVCQQPVSTKYNFVKVAKIIIIWGLFSKHLMHFDFSFNKIKSFPTSMAIKFSNSGPIMGSSTITEYFNYMKIAVPIGLSCARDVKNLRGLRNNTEWIFLVRIWDPI